MKHRTRKHIPHFGSTLPFHSRSVHIQVQTTFANYDAEQNIMMFALGLPLHALNSIGTGRNVTRCSGSFLLTRDFKLFALRMQCICLE